MTGPVERERYGPGRGIAAVLNHIDGAVAMLSSLEVVKADNETNRRVVWHVTKDYELEQRTQLRESELDFTLMG